MQYRNSTTNSHRTQVMPNQLVIVIVWSVNLNVSYKLHPYSLLSMDLTCLQATSSQRNYYNLKGKDIRDVHFFFFFFFFFGRGIILWIRLPWPENPANTSARNTEALDRCFNLIRSHQQCIQWFPPLDIEPATTECRTESLTLTINSHRTQVMTNQLVMIIAPLINLNVSCKLHAYFSLAVHLTNEPQWPCLSINLITNYS